MTEMDKILFAEAKVSKFSNMMVKRPLRVFAIVIPFVLIFTLIAFGSNYFDITDYSKRQSYAWSNPVVENNEIQKVAEHYFNQEKLKDPRNNVPSRSDDVEFWKTCILYMNHNSTNQFGVYDK